MKTALALLALALAATAAVADVVNPNDPLLPPVEFDKPYAGELIVVVARDAKHLGELCASATRPDGREAYACAGRAPGVCRIVLPPLKDGKFRGYPAAMLIRHEIAHCNGWSDDHPGARPFKIWADVEKAKRVETHPAVTEAYQLAEEINAAASQFDDFARHVVGKTVAEVAKELAKLGRLPFSPDPSGARFADTFIRAAKDIGLSPKSRITPELLSNPVTARVLARGAADIGTKLSEEQWREAHLVAFNASKARQAENAAIAAAGQSVPNRGQAAPQPQQAQPAPPVPNDVLDDSRP